MMPKREMHYAADLSVTPILSDVIAEWLHAEITNPISLSRFPIINFVFFPQVAFECSENLGKYVSKVGKSRKVKVDLTKISDFPITSTKKCGNRKNGNRICDFCM